MHDHAPGIRGTGNRRLLGISLAITAVVMVVQIVGAVLSGSLALLADAAHMFTDAAALVIALIASVVAARPANDRRTFGFQRAEVFGALANGVILIGLSVWVAFEGIQRLLNPGEVEVSGGLMLVVAIVGLVANAVAMWLLSAAQRTSINVRGAYLEVMGDLIGSAAVIVAAIVIVTTGLGSGRRDRVAADRRHDHPARHLAAARGHVGAERVHAQGDARHRDPRSHPRDPGCRGLP